MKPILIPFCFLIFLSCKAQNPIVPIYDDTSAPYVYHDRNSGEYFKDVYNDFNLFEGTWLYTNGNTSFKVVLEKKVMQHIVRPNINLNYYSDLLYGEYQYIENGVTKVNTLSAMTLNIEPVEHNLYGGSITKYNPNVPEACPDCNPGDVKVGLLFREPGVDIEGSNMSIYFRYYIENGVEKLEATIVEQGFRTRHINDTSPQDNYSVPSENVTYILTKQ